MIPLDMLRILFLFLYIFTVFAKNEETDRLDTTYNRKEVTLKDDNSAETSTTLPRLRIKGVNDHENLENLDEEHEDEFSSSFERNHENKDDDPRLSKPCKTTEGQDGICTYFQECYPILFGFEKLGKNPRSSQLQKDVLASTTKCSSPEIDNSPNRNQHDVICCVVETRQSENSEGNDVVSIEVEDSISGEKQAESNLENFNETGIESIEGGGTGISIPADTWLGGNLITGNRPPLKNGSVTPPMDPLIQSSCVESKVVNLVVPPHEAVAPKGSYPWMAALINPRGTQFCGGSLIDNYHILTAAHCIAHLKKPAEVGKIRVYLGAHNLYASETSRVSYKIARILKHAKYSDKNFTNDIALLKLAQAVKLIPSVIQPVCLNKKEGYDDGTKNATLAGWGRTSVVGGPSPILRHGTMRVWKNEECQQRYTQYIGAEQIPMIQPTMVCGGSSGVDACQGDSGGPLFMKHGNTTSEQIGIVSWGIGCGLYPGVYTRVDKYISWINKNRGLSVASAAAPAPAPAPALAATEK